MKAISTKVMNVITEKYDTYYNKLSLEENLISSIILSTEDSRKIFDLDYRDKITREAKVEYIQSKDGTMKCYSPSYDMIAYEIN
jgi:hypothetical protein